MKRVEYRRFRQVCETELNKEKYFFQDHTTDPYYRWGYARIRRKDSEFIRVGQEHMKMQTGIFIDIFPVDYVPDVYPLRVLHGFYCFILRKLLYAEVGMVTSKSILQRSLYKLLNRIPLQFTFRRLERLAAACNKAPTQFIRNYTFPKPKGQFGSSAALYEKLSEIEFEGHKFMAYENYDEYLSNKYSDYMTMPPPEKRHWHPASKIKLPE